MQQPRIYPYLLHLASRCSQRCSPIWHVDPPGLIVGTRAVINYGIFISVCYDVMFGFLFNVRSVPNYTIFDARFESNLEESDFGPRTYDSFMGFTLMTMLWHAVNYQIDSTSIWNHIYYPHPHLISVLFPLRIPM